jgi:hypothetical protein
MKKNKSTIILILVFFVGLSVMLYPTISDYVNQRNQSRAVANYAQDVDNMTDADYSAYFDAADAFNAQVAANENALFRPDQLTGYNETLDITGTGIMGYITISKIGVELPIYHGTSDSVLQIAAGHLEGTSLPVGILGGVNGQSRVVHLTVGDYAVLVSDGLLVDGPGWVAKQLELSAAAGEAPEKVAKTLVETARVRAQKTGRPDDITAAVLRLEKCV